MAVAIIKSRIVKEILSEEYEYEIPTSMIDVVFLLLLFFIAGTKMRTSEQKMDTELPKDAGINPIPTKVIPPREYRVKIDGVSPPPAPIFMVDNMPVKDVNDLAFKLRSAAASSPQLSVVLVGKPQTPFKYVINALDACKIAEIEDVKFEGFAVEGMGKAVGDNR
jgi:biopolymer transport protein ExbD